MYETIDDLTAPWLGNGVTLATAMLVLVDEIRGTRLSADEIADTILEVVKCEYDPATGVRRDWSMFDPPEVRPPANHHPGAGVATEPGA